MAGGGDESADDLFSAAVQAYQNQHYQIAVDLLQRVLKLDPKYKGAWDDLGDAYMSLGKTDKAIAAFKTADRKQSLRRVCLQRAGAGLSAAGGDIRMPSSNTRSRSRSIRSIHTRTPILASCISSQKKFSEAVPELEKAVDIQPKNPLLEIALGQAYIGTNQTDKGMAAFEKAISMSATPLTWNNIAYSLSEQNVQLDRAQQYADSAINALDTQLRDVTLDNLRMQDLGTTPVAVCGVGHATAGSNSSAAIWMLAETVHSASMAGRRHG